MAASEEDCSTWLAKSDKCPDLSQKDFKDFKVRDALYEDLIAANAVAILGMVKIITKQSATWHIGLAYIRSSESAMPDQDGYHRYTMALYDVGSSFVRGASSTDEFQKDLMKKLGSKLKIEYFPSTPVGQNTDERIVIFLSRKVEQDTRKLTKIPLPITHIIQPGKKDAEYDIRIVAYFYIGKIAAKIEQDGIEQTESWDKDKVKLIVGKSFLTKKPSAAVFKKNDITTWSRRTGDGIGSRWQYYKNKNRGWKQMIPLVVITNDDLLEPLKRLASYLGKDDTVGDSRDAITLDIEAALARRGELWGFQLDNDQRDDHPTPKKGGGDASIIYLVYRYEEEGVAGGVAAAAAGGTAAIGPEQSVGNEGAVERLEKELAKERQKNTELRKEIEKLTEINNQMQGLSIN